MYSIFEIRVKRASFTISINNTAGKNSLFSVKYLTLKIPSKLVKKIGRNKTNSNAIPAAVVLHKKIHKEFHRLYGHDNTESQFKEFKKNITEERVNELQFQQKEI